MSSGIYFTAKCHWFQQLCLYPQFKICAISPFRLVSVIALRHYYPSNSHHRTNCRYSSISRFQIFSEPLQNSILLKKNQFPIRLAVSMPINKAKEKTLDSVVIYLPDRVFGQDQLYVALYRAKKPADIKIVLNREASSFSNHDGLYTANVVYGKVLQ